MATIEEKKAAFIAKLIEPHDPGQIPPVLPPAPPGATYGGMDPSWQQSVDRQLAQLHADVRALLKVGASAVVALAVMIGGLYLYTNTKFDTVQQGIAATQVQQQKTDGKIDVLLERTPTAK